jgi:hypothetical protein
VFCFEKRVFVFTYTFISSRSLFTNISPALSLREMVHIDTKSLTGLRGLAAMHVAVGHFFIFSQQPTQVSHFNNNYFPTSGGS